MRFEPVQTDECDDLSRLMREVTARQIVLWVDNGRLMYEGPPGCISEDLRKRLERNRQQLVKWLASPVVTYRGWRPEVPMADHHLAYWREIQRGAFDVAFLNGTSAVFNLRFKFDREDLERRVRSVLDRHTILRSHVVQGSSLSAFRDGGPEAVALEVIDIRGKAANGTVDLKTLARDVAADRVWQPFNEATGPLARCFAVVFGAAEYLFGVVVHHFICDALSFRMIVNELLAGSSKTADSPLRLSDYILAMNEWTRGFGARLRLEYWMCQLRGAPRSRIPPDQLAAMDHRADLCTVSCNVSANIVDRLATIAICERTTLFTVLLAFKIGSLAVISNARDILVLMQHSGRARPALFGIVGSLTDRLPIRVQVAPKMRFRALLRAVSKTVMTAFRYEVPNAMIEEAASGIGVSLSVPAVNFIDLTEASDGRAKTLNAVPVQIGMPPRQGSPRKYSSHWLNIVRSNFGLHVQLGYSPALYKEETVRAYLSAFVRLLGEGADDLDGMLPAETRIG